MQANTVKCTLCKRWIHKQYSGVRSNLSLVVDGLSCKRCDSTIQESDLAKDLVMDGETYGSVICETLLMDMVERILLQQLESKCMKKVPREYVISGIQSSPSGVCQLCQKQHDLWN